MPPSIPIEDPEDERVADFVLLNDPELRRLREHTGGEEGGFFIAEGMLVIRQLLRSSYRVRAMLLTPARLADLSDSLAALDTPVYVASQAVVNAISGFHLHRGALASASRRANPSLADVATPAELMVVAEGLNDHENLGSLFRNAAAFGVGGVVLDPTRPIPSTAAPCGCRWATSCASPSCGRPRGPMPCGTCRAWASRCWH